MQHHRAGKYNGPPAASLAATMPRPILIIVASKNNLRTRFAPLQAPFPLAAGALAKLWCIKELRGSESRYSVLWARAL